MSNFLFFGEDKLELDQSLRQIKDKFSQKYSAHNIDRVDFDKEDISIQDLQAKLQTVPFLAKKRLLIINNLFSSFAKRDQKKVKTLVGQINLTPPSTILVLIEDKNISSGLQKKLKNYNFKIKNFKQSYGYKLEGWLQSKAKQLDLIISNQVAKLMIERLGSDTGLIFQELLKLKSYLAFDNRNQIELKDIKQVVSTKTDLKIFDLMDQVANKKKDKAIEYLFDMLDDGVSEVYIITMLDTTLTNILKALDLRDSQSNLTSDKLKKEFGWHPFVAKKVFSQMNHYNKKSLVSIYQKLFEADINLKTGKSDPKTELTLFLSQL